jgi:hypothetical protein
MHKSKTNQKRKQWIGNSTCKTSENKALKKTGAKTKTFKSQTERK